MIIYAIIGRKKFFTCAPLTRLFCSTPFPFIWIRERLFIKYLNYWAPPSYSLMNTIAKMFSGIHATYYHWFDVPPINIHVHRGADQSNSFGWEDANKIAMYAEHHNYFLVAYIKDLHRIFNSFFDVRFWKMLCIHQQPTSWVATSNAAQRLIMWWVINIRHG